VKNYERVQELCKELAKEIGEEICLECLDLKQLNFEESKYAMLYIVIDEYLNS